MNKLNGPFVIIALNINEGRGFDFLEHPLYIEASLKESRIESDPVIADSNPLICTELVWETEKKEVRKLRSSHVPLRVDCYTLDANKHREKIGFVLLSLRSAEPITSNQLQHATYKWNKIITSTYKYRQCNPELSLNLTIRDQLEIVPNLPTMEPIIQAPKSEVIPIMYLDAGLIQIGDNLVASEVYSLSFTLKTTNNLDVLLPETKVFQQNSDKYFISLTVLGLTITSKYFYSNLHQPIPLNDRVIFKLQSNIALLKMFFEQYENIPVNFCHGDDVLGSTEIYIKNFICVKNMCSDGAYSSENDYEFKAIVKDVDGRKPYITIRTTLRVGLPDLNKELNKKKSENSVKKSDAENRHKSSKKEDQTVKNTCEEVKKDIFESKKDCSEVKDNDLKVDIVELKIEDSIKECQIEDGNLGKDLIKDVEGKSDNLEIVEIRKHSPRKHCITVQCDNQHKLYPDENMYMASGDQILSPKAPIPTGFKRMSPCRDVSIQTFVPAKRTASIETQASFKYDLHIQKSSSSLPENIFNSSNYHLHSLTIEFRSIIWRKQVVSPGYRLKLHHPKAKSDFVVHTNANIIQPNIITSFDNVYCNMLYVTTKENAKILVSQYAPKVSIYNLDNVPITDPLQIDTKLFLLENRTDCTYFAVLNKIFRKDDLICDLQVNLKLIDLGSDLEVDNYESNTLKPLVLDECFALKTLQDHLDWKQSQEITFMEKLKTLEKDKLETLQKEWTMKRKELELHLQDGIEKCKTMSQDLSIAIRHVKNNSNGNYDDPPPLFASDDNREVIEMRVTQMLEEEMNATIDRIEHEKYDLSRKIERLSADKLTLESKITDLESQLEYLRKTTLTKEQTACLLKQVRSLEEEFYLIQKAKAFFKEQWQKALNEVHMLKSEDQRQIQKEIQKNKEELNQYNDTGERRCSSDTKLLQHTPRYVNEERVCSFLF